MEAGGLERGLHPARKENNVPLTDQSAEATKTTGSYWRSCPLPPVLGRGQTKTGVVSIPGEQRTWRDSSARSNRENRSCRCLQLVESVVHVRILRFASRGYRIAGITRISRERADEIAPTKKEEHEPCLR